jgi:hypothetical protein
MTQYVAVEAATMRVRFGVGRPDPEGYAGALSWRPFPHDGLIFMPWQGRLPLSDAPTSTAVLEWHGDPVWVEKAPLADVIARAIDLIDGAADAARMEVIARQTNTPEYQRAEVQARAFKAAGYPEDDVPRNVAGWAGAKYRDGWTAQQAADDIIATADRWYDLLDDIRDLRLMAKEDVRHAADAAETEARVTKFEADLLKLMKGS